jgi:hypothetical protein
MYAAAARADRLTGFYLAMAVGGALGGIFSGTGRADPVRLDL